MHCNEAKKYLYPFVDNELSKEAVIQLVDHLLQCQGCMSLFNKEERFRKKIQCCSNPDCLPAHMRQQLIKLMNHESLKRYD